MKNFSLTDRENCAIILKQIRCCCGSVGTPLARGVQRGNRRRRHLAARRAANLSQEQTTYATVAQSVEQLIRNQQVAGSSPASSSIEKPLIFL